MINVTLVDGWMDICTFTCKTRERGDRQEETHPSAAQNPAYLCKDDMRVSANQNFQLNIDRSFYAPSLVRSCTYK